ncbi:hypothetical protein ACHAPU_006661 [Fusarium lateritium]
MPPTPSVSISVHLTGVSAGNYKITVTGPDGSVVSRHEMTFPSGVLTDPGSQTRCDAITTTPMTFPWFKYLPAEIRVKIRNLSLNEPRIFWPPDDGEGGEVDEDLLN